MSEVASNTIAREDLYGLAAEFTTTPGIYHAAEKTNSAGYKWFDCLVPFPVHGLDRAMGVKMTILPILVFFGGMIGLTLACCLQIFTNSLEFDIWALIPVVGYQYDVSGKPLLGAAAFVPVAFEMTILFSALTAVFGSLFLNKLPMFYHPTLKHPALARATDDRFYLIIEARDPKFSLDEVEAFLNSLNPETVIALEK
ncbi:MAG TPA: DUF3341 domain-containing protein [Phycisphaerales bacterium]|jgi:hypothetical protein|nr:DUF3341 domain-containing protein [Phycisphaerales bacterium]HIB00454.1 DUF3341 domain-containing protein [Phycisphaerales bacterium]HIB49876.1 DUF3341 domain-containing protein [Phycisphaerales bacterium]HIN83699.1 DUF3341 domain-containing protein [Phycisphaerales bacterium]HIO20769.1 DUF3341 domain-containing protein [Phycisphaerales bacterium]